MASRKSMARRWLLWRLMRKRRLGVSNSLKKRPSLAFEVKGSLKALEKTVLNLPVLNLSSQMQAN